MEKEIVILTKSRKYKNYCVAGIDLSNGEWIRLISEDTDIHNAVRPQDLIYENDDEVQILDKVIVECEMCNSNFYQPENIILNTEYYIKFNGRVNPSELLPFLSTRDYIFYDSNNKIHKDKLVKHITNDNHSLVLIKPEYPIINVKTWNNGKKTVKSSFRYNNIWYRYLSITDHLIEEEYLNKEDGDYRLQQDVLFVISLGEVYYSDDCHYKLIASIIEM